MDHDHCFRTQAHHFLKTWAVRYGFLSPATPASIPYFLTLLGFIHGFLSPTSTSHCFRTQAHRACAWGQQNGALFWNRSPSFPNGMGIHIMDFLVCNKRSGNKSHLRSAAQSKFRVDQAWALTWTVHVGLCWTVSLQSYNIIINVGRILKKQQQVWSTKMNCLDKGRWELANVNECNWLSI